MTRGRSSLALFDSWQVSSGSRRATVITLDGHDPVLPGAAKITLIVPRGLKEPPFQTENWSVLLARWNDATAALTCLLGQVGPDGPINFHNPQSYDHGLDGIGNRGFDFSFRGFPSSYWAI